MKIWVHTLVHNEENFIWFAIMSVIDYVDKVIVWDTGSTDGTVSIIKEIIKEKGDKIEFKEVGKVDKYTLPKMRQKMVEISTCDWIMVLDGDEIWPEKSLLEVIRVINKEGKNVDGIVVPFYNLVGDIYHYQHNSTGRYNILGRTGHLQVRFINRHIKGLHVKGIFPLEAYRDENGQAVQDSKKLIYVDSPYLHASHLIRSGQKRRYRKTKFDLGLTFPANFDFPKALYQTPPKGVVSQWKKRGVFYELISIFIYPLVFLKRYIESLHL